MAPLLSIIIPVYNAEEFVAEAIQSAIDQTWPAKEIIAVDDGSMDRSREILKSFSARGIKIIEQENRGASAARNRGLKEARGEFIQFLDADDLLAPEKIEIQMNRLGDAPAGSVASCAWGRFHDVPKSSVFVPEPVWTDSSSVDWIISSWLGGGMMPCHAWLAPRSAIEPAGPWNETLSTNDDGEYFTRVLLHSNSVVFCEGARAYYRSGLSESLSRGLERHNHSSVHQSLELCARHLLAVENSERTRAACATQFQRFIYAAYPAAPDLVRRADARVREFGGSDLKPGGGQLFQVTSKALGWKAARRMQRAVRS